MAVVIIYCNFFNNACEQESTAYYTFMPSTFFGQLLEMKLSSLEFLEPFRSEVSVTKIYFTVQYFELLKIEPKVNIAFAILP